MKKTSYIVLLFAAMICSCPVLMAATPSAGEIVRKMVESVRAAKSLSVDFSATFQGATSKGNLLLCGNKFILTSDELKVWFNGKTQWAYSPALGEVNISEPVQEEIVQINPFAIVSALQSQYKSRLTAESDDSYTVDLTPVKAGSPYKKVVVVVSKTTNLPLKVVVTASDGITTSITVSNVKKGDIVPPSKFSVNQKTLPGVEFVDLR